MDAVRRCRLRLRTKKIFHRPSTTQRRNSRTSLSPLFPDTIPAKLWSTTTTRVDFCAREDARNTNQILLISRARIQNRSREGFLKFKRVRSPSARDREWVGVTGRRQKVGRASSSSPEWCWLLRAKKREREKTSLLKSARSQKGDDGLKSPEFSEETKKKLERSRRKMYKKKQTKK